MYPKMDALTEVIRSILLEGRFDEPTRRVSRAVMTAINTLIQYVMPVMDEPDYKKSYDRNMEVEVAGFDQVKVRIRLIFVDSPEVDVTGSQMGTSITVEVRIPGSFDGGMLRSRLNWINDEVVNAARHELEHLIAQAGADYAKAGTGMIKTHDVLRVLDQYTKYLTQPSEVAAHAAGIYRMAQRRREPVEKTLISTYTELVNRWHSLFQNADRLQHFRKAQDASRFAILSWAEAIKERYPNAQLDLRQLAQTLRSQG